MNDENINLNDSSFNNNNNSNQKSNLLTNKIKIYAKDQLYTFEKDKYNGNLLSNILSKNEFDKIIENCSKLMGQSWVEKRTKDQVKIPSWIIGFSILSVILTIVYMITLYLSTTVENGTALFVVSIICISSASLIVFGMSIYNFCRKIGHFESLSSIIKDKLDTELKQANNKYNNINFSYNEVKKCIVVTVKDKYISKNVNNKGNNNIKNYILNSDCREETQLNRNNKNIEMKKFN